MGRVYTEPSRGGGSTFYPAGKTAGTTNGLATGQHVYGAPSYVRATGTGTAYDSRAVSKKPDPDTDDRGSYGSYGSSNGSGANFDALMDLYMQMYYAQVAQAQKEKRDREANNKTTYGRQVGLNNNSFNQTDRAIQNAMKGGLSGGLISERINNSLQRANANADAYQSMIDANNANESLYFDNTANAMQGLANNTLGLVSNMASYANDDDYYRILSKLRSI